MITEYQPGTYCSDINCANLKPLVALGISEYLTEKNELCRECGAWAFYKWLRAGNWTISSPHRVPSVSSAKTSSSRPTWSDPDTEESSALRSFFT
ncbi:MAG: hypothetical protein KBA15_00155 [Spirochaetes bacterium]|jgi:hypothetical protein|nr:hypothetical protein [Spirochaetota bacterium]